MRTTRTTVAVWLGLVGVALVTRLVWLDADPARFKRASELTDEGFWAHNARAAVVLGTPFPDDLAQAPASAPLFHSLVEGTFRTLGVSYASLRLVPAVASILLVPLVILLVAPPAGAAVATVTALLVLADHELFTFGRLGMPESLHMLFAVAGVAVWIQRRNPWWSAAAGTLFAVAALAKLNVLVIAGLAGVWALEALQGRRLARDLAAFVGGFAPVLAAWGLAGYAPHAALFALNNVALNRDRLLLQPSDLGRLPLHFLNNGFWGLPSTFLLAALAARHVGDVAARFAGGWRAGIATLSPLETLAIGWTLGIAAPTALLVRAVDERRIVVLLVPLAIFAALGLCRARPPAPTARASATTVVILALAVTVVALVLAFTAGHGATFWSWGFVAALAAGALLAAGLARLATRGALTGTRAVHAILVVAAVVPALNLGRFAEWATPVPGWLVTGVGLAALAAVVTEHGRRAASVVLAAYLAWGAVAIGVNLVRPTYTLREASAAIGALTRPGDAIVGAFAHTLALDNRTHPVWYTPARAYNRLLNPDLARFPVRFILTAEGVQVPRAEAYPFRTTPVRTLELFPAPRGGFKVIVELHRREP